MTLSDCEFVYSEGFKRMQLNCRAVSLALTYIKIKNKSSIKDFFENKVKPKKKIAITFLITCLVIFCVILVEVKLSRGDF